MKKKPKVRRSVKHDPWMYKAGNPLDPFNRERTGGSEGILLRRDTEQQMISRLLTTASRVQQKTRDYHRTVIKPLMDKAVELEKFYVYPEVDDGYILQYHVSPSRSYHMSSIELSKMDPVLADMLRSITYDQLANNFGNILHNALAYQHNRWRIYHRIRSIIHTKIERSISNSLPRNCNDRYIDRVFRVDVPLGPNHQHSSNAVSFFVRVRDYRATILINTQDDYIETHLLENTLCTPHPFTV